MSSSENDGIKPPELREAAKRAAENVLPAKSKIKYEAAYNVFLKWKIENKAIISENCLIVYFKELMKKYKPTSVWAHYSMMKTMIKLKENIDISQYHILGASLKKNSIGFQSKKSELFTGDQIKKFLKEAPDDTYLAHKRLSYTFRGHMAPVLTPFLNDSTRSLNLSIIPQYAEFLADRGVTGVLANGTSGEGPSMTVQERKTVAETWARAVKSTKQHLMVQVGGTSLPNVLELANHAENIGVDSLLCLPELYFKPTTPKQLVEYLRLVGQAAPKTPLLYYHIPMFTNVNINMPQFLESVGDRIPSLVGIKFSSANLEEATQVFHVNNKEFVIFLGNDQIMAGGFAQGLDSAITTTMNMLPDIGIGILKASASGDIVKARELQEKLAKASKAISKYGTRVETMKAAMGLLTPFDMGPPRAPMNPLSAESIALMKQGLQALRYQVLR